MEGKLCAGLALDLVCSAVMFMHCHIKGAITSFEEGFMISTEKATASCVDLAALDYI